MKALAIIFGTDSFWIHQQLGKTNCISKVLTEVSQFPQVEETLLCLPAGTIISETDELKKNNVSVLSLEEWTTQCFFSTIEEKCKNFESVWFTNLDSPFCNKNNASLLWQIFSQYGAEYVFADGYPDGLFPELIASGIVPALKMLSQKMPITTLNGDSLFSVIKTDINSFEIETQIAPKDMRCFRAVLRCSYKRDYLLVSKIYDELKEDFSADSICEYIVSHQEILRTVPSFYAIQIQGDCKVKCSYCPFVESDLIYPQKSMDLSKFETIIKKIADYSSEAVVSLSFWGEPALNSRIVDFVKTVLKYPGLSVFIETSGVGWKIGDIESIAILAQNASPRTNGHSPVEFVVSLDATNQTEYEVLHKDADYSEVLSVTEKLIELFSSSVWPQFVRLNETEDYLENFYRFWKEKLGRVLIQKYDDFCKQLPDKKPTDLSPLVRNPCWHIKRDMNILLDGTVIPCRELIKKEDINKFSFGNIFEAEICDLWKKGEALYKQHILKQYPLPCGKCDEYYTFNF